MYSFSKDLLRNWNHWSKSNILSRFSCSMCKYKEWWWMRERKRNTLFFRLWQIIYIFFKKKEDINVSGATISSGVEVEGRLLGDHPVMRENGSSHEDPKLGPISILWPHLPGEQSDPALEDSSGAIRLLLFSRSMYVRAGNPESMAGWEQLMFNSMSILTEPGNLVDSFNVTLLQCFSIRWASGDKYLRNSTISLTVEEQSGECINPCLGTVGKEGTFL